MILKQNNEYRDKLKFYCKTSYIDRLVCKAKNIPFDESFLADMEREARMYVAVTHDNILLSEPGYKLEPYVVKQRGSKKFKKIYNPLKDMAIPDKDTAELLEKFIQSVHGVSIKIAWIS